MEDMRRSHICHQCGGRMYNKTTSQDYNYNGHLITIDDVELFECEECSEKILESAEVKRIEDIILARVGEKKEE